MFDYKEATIPEELIRWHVTEEEIDEALVLLGRDHATQNPVEQAAEGDSLRCRDSQGRTVLLYPGRKLPGALETEQAALGHRAGESFSCRLGETEVTLRIEEILRLEPYPLGDDLVKLAGIEGVETAADYRSWFLRETEPKKREDALKKITRYLWEALSERSQIEIDQTEQDYWCGIRAKGAYDSMVKNGCDPHIPEEGTEFLSDEEALAKLVREQQPEYRKFVAARHVSQQDGFVYTKELFTKDVDRFIADFRERLLKDGYDMENAYSDEEFLSWEADAYVRHAFELLDKAAEQYLEV